MGSVLVMSSGQSCHENHNRLISFCADTGMEKRLDILEDNDNDFEVMEVEFTDDED